MTSQPTPGAPAANMNRCLLLVSGASQGNSAHSFIHSFTLASSLFAVTIASPGGSPLNFPETDPNSKRWLDDFLTKPVSHPVPIESLDLSPFNALLIPGGVGAAFDLAKSATVAHTVIAFDRDKKLICAVGWGTAALCSSAILGDRSADWQFSGRCLTGPSNAEVARTLVMANQPLLLEDFIRDNGGVYSASKPDSIHVVIDNNIITAQNDASTLSAVQNLILLSNNSRSNKRS